MAFEGKPTAASRWFDVTIRSPRETAERSEGAEVVWLRPPWPTRGEAPAEGSANEAESSSVAPSEWLMREFAAEDRWDEFRRRYHLELRTLPSECERLRSIACDASLVLIDASGDPQQRVALALREHLERLECQRRWDAGLMLGGMTWPVKREIIEAGGLWFGPHKAWMLPDEKSLAEIRKLLPGDF